MEKKNSLELLKKLLYCNFLVKHTAATTQLKRRLELTDELLYQLNISISNNEVSFWTELLVACNSAGRNARGGLSALSEAGRITAEEARVRREGYRGLFEGVGRG